MHPSIAPSDTLYDEPRQNVIFISYSYLAITLSKADFGPFTLLSCYRVCYLPYSPKGSA
jgi:hypothetical protein